MNNREYDINSNHACPQCHDDGPGFLWLIDHLEQCTGEPRFTGFICCCNKQFRGDEYVKHVREHGRECFVKLAMEAANKCV